MPSLFGSDDVVTEFFSAGSASAPSVASINDLDTGMYWESSNNLAISTGGVKRMRVNNTEITASIGVTGPKFYSNTGTAASGLTTTVRTCSLNETGLLLLAANSGSGDNSFRCWLYARHSTTQANLLEVVTTGPNYLASLTASTGVLTVTPDSNAVYACIVFS